MEAQRIGTLPDDELKSVLNAASKEKRLLYFAELIKLARPYWYKASREAKHRKIATAAKQILIVDRPGPFPLSQICGRFLDVRALALFAAMRPAARAVMTGAAGLGRRRPEKLPAAAGAQGPCVPLEGAGGREHSDRAPGHQKVTGGDAKTAYRRHACACVTGIYRSPVTKRHPSWSAGHGTCMNAARVAGAIEFSRRRDNVSYSHHAVAPCYRVTRRGGCRICRRRFLGNIQICIFPAVSWSTFRKFTEG